MISHGDALVLDVYLDGFPESHHVLIDGVVQHLLQQHVDAVVGGGAIAQLADVHAGAVTDMFLPLKGDDIFFYIIAFQ